MSEEDDGQEKTFEPTAKRVRDFRERGEVPRSNEVLSAAGLTVGFTVLYLWSANLANGMSNIFIISYNDISDHDFSVAMAEEIGGAVLGIMAFMILPPLVFMWFGAAIVGLIQQRLAFPKDPFKFEPNKLNPISGFKEKFMSPRPLVDALKSVLKLVLIGGLIAVAFWEASSCDQSISWASARVPTILYSCSTGTLAECNTLQAVATAVDLRGSILHVPVDNYMYLGTYPTFLFL